MDRRLVITVGKDAEFPFLVETEYYNGFGWNCLSRTSVRLFPWVAVQRVADRKDYTILVRNRAL